MSQDDFIAALVESVHNTSIVDTLAMIEKPSGRRPSHSLVQLSEWYNRLTPDEQAHLRQVVEHAVHATLFGVLSVIDGVRSIESTEEKSELYLLIERAGKQRRINSPEEEYLHDKYQSLVYERVFGQQT